ncbi:hypothetical protein GQ600_10008 [Phytophthora cactorum]|nr:hypothetical protein GQ600_10008 [Phytophthora cactorum]
MLLKRRHMPTGTMYASKRSQGCQASQEVATYDFVVLIALPFWQRDLCCCPSDALSHFPEPLTSGAIACNRAISVTKPSVPGSFVYLAGSHDQLLAEAMSQSVTPRTFIETAIPSRVFPCSVHPTIFPRTHVDGKSCTHTIRHCSTDDLLESARIGTRICIGVDWSSELHTTISMPTSVLELTIVFACTRPSCEHTFAVEDIVLVLAFVSIPTN